MSKYSIEFKSKVINDYVGGMSKEAVAAKYHVAHSSVVLWTQEYRTNNQPSVSREEYLEQQELNRLRIDNLNILMRISLLRHLRVPTKQGSVRKGYFSIVIKGRSIPPFLFARNCGNTV